jgi:hypothetical protein
MRDAEAGKLGEEQLRVLDPLHNAWLIAEQRPSLGDSGEQRGAILEARAVQDTEER